MTLQITFRDFAASEAIEESVRAEATQLAKHTDSISSCHVTLAAPRGGTYFHIQIEAAVPGHTLVISHDTPHGETGEGFYRALRDAFRRTRERIDQISARSREDRRDLRG
jgi:ribosome-associated translation inhibitor RaiA